MATEKKGGRYFPGGFGAGVGAAIIMMLVMAVLRFTSNTISIPELMEESLIRIAGGQLESNLINALGVGGKALLLVTIIEGTLLLGGILGWVFTRFWPVSGEGPSWRWISGVLYGLLLGLFLNIVFLPLVDQGFFGSTALSVTAPPEIAQALYGTDLAPFGIPVFLTMFILSLVFGLALVAILPWQRYANVDSATAPATVSAAAADGGRRDFMKALGGGALALVGGAGLWAIIRRTLEPPGVAGVQVVDDAPPVASASPTAKTEANANPGAPEATPPMGEAQPTPPMPPGFEGVKPLLVPAITPTDSFYITTKNFVDPTVDGNAWNLSFKGMVDNPYTITLKDVMAMPVINKTHTLACISNPVGGSLIGNANWKGVDFGELLRRAKPQSGASEIIVRAADGYADSFPLKIGLDSGVVLAYQMNGADLVGKHGYPVRLLVPNIYGMKNCKWLTEVELTNNDFQGYWEAQGWSDTAVYQTMSRIDYPDKNSIAAGPLYVGGVAFAGSRGIKRVEVSTDGGQTWSDAQLRASLGPDTWTQWLYPWLPTAGDYTLKVRATDGTGEVQTADPAATYPDGATGYHGKRVRVA
ncbi:MAG: molybdopterin-dependent oxidoreductase [Chloroflexota bacterium]